MINVTTTVVIMIAGAAQQIKQLAELAKPQSFGRNSAGGRELIPVLVNSIPSGVRSKQLSTPGPLTDLSKPYAFANMMSTIAHNLSTQAKPLGMLMQGTTISSTATGFWA